MLPPAERAEATEIDGVQQQIETVLAEYGGVQTSWNEVSGDDGATVLTLVGVEPLSSASTGSCASGKHCAFANISGSGNKLTFSSCASNQSVAALGSVRSIVNNRANKTVSAYKGSQLLAAAGPNSSANVVNGTTALSCG